MRSLRAEAEFYRRSLEEEAQLTYGFRKGGIPPALLHHIVCAYGDTGRFNPKRTGEVFYVGTNASGGQTSGDWRTWVKPKNASFVYLWAAGSGAGGGAGLTAATSNAKGGGAGGGSGSSARLLIPARFLPPTLYYFASMGGAGGATSAATGGSGTRSFVSDQPGSSTTSILVSESAAATGGTGGLASGAATVGAGATNANASGTFYLLGIWQAGVAGSVAFPLLALTRWSGTSGGSRRRLAMPVRYQPPV